MYVQLNKVTVLSVLFLIAHQIFSQTRTESEAVFAVGSNDVGALENSVNLFTGDVEFPMTLISNNANGGMKMEVNLFYNSNVNTQANTWNRDAPTSVVGLGWSMNTPKIVVDNKQTGTRKDDEYFLVDGASTPLIYNHSVYRSVEGHTGSHSARLFKSSSYNNWDIYYMENLEMWEIIREDGSKLIYGDQVNHPTTVEWIVKWDNWIGNSAVTSGQSRQAIIWNLANVEDLWGNGITYTYDKVEQRVSAGSGGLLHTEASYLTKIEDYNGKKIELTYEEKNDYEFYEPHTEINYNATTNVAEPDGYQERYEREYLSEVSSYNEFGNLLRKVTLEYNFCCFQNGQDDYLKRYLKKITNFNSELEADFPTDFTYNYSQPGYKGALTRVTSPTGSYIQYTYDLNGHSIANSDLNLTINRPSGYEMPQVFHGHNYAVVTWRNPTTQQVSFKIYEWTGYWSHVATTTLYSVGRETNSNPNIQPGYTNFQITLEKDFVGIANRHLNSTFLRAFSRDPNNATWLSYQKILQTETNYQLVSGEKFIALQEQTKGTLHAIRWDGESWDYDLVMDEIPSNWDNNYYATAGNNYVHVHNPQIARRGPSISNYIWYLAESGLWQERIGPLINISHNNNRTWAATNSSVIGIKQVGSEIAYDWDTDYNYKNMYNLSTYGTTTTNKFISIGNSLLSFNNGANAGNVNFNSQNTMLMARFDGSTWKTRATSDYWAQFSAIGTDYLLSGSGRLNRYNPNTGTWSLVYMSGANSSDRKPALSLSGAAYLWPYFRQFNNDGTHQDILISSVVSNRGKAQTHQAGSNFVIHNRYNSGTGVYLHYLKNDQDVSTYVGSKRVPEYDDIAASGNQFHLYATSSSTHTYDDATSITLYKVMPDQNGNAKFQGELKDYPVKYITHNDGVNNRYTSFDFEEGTAKMDVTGSKALYAKATTFHGTSNKSASIGGKTVSYFYNGMPLISGHPEENGSNERNYYKRLIGQSYKTQVYNVSTLQASTHKYFKVEREPITNFTGTLGHQYIALPVARINVTDGLETSSEYFYNNLKQLSRTESKYNDGLNTRTVYQYQEYIWEHFPPAAQQQNLLSPVVFRKSKEGGTWKSASVTTWKDWGGGAWSPRTSYNWRGTGGTPTFTSWTSNGTVSNWQRTTDITARNSVGNITESRDINNRYSAIRYGYDGELPMLTVYEAQDHQIFVDDFNDGSLNDADPISWYGSSWSNTNGAISTSSSGTSERKLSMTSYYSGTSFIIEFDARVKSSNYGSWVGFRMKGTSYTSGNGEYVVKFFPNTGIVQLQRNGSTLAASSYGSITNVNEWKHFRIERHYNSIFQIYVDDKLAVSSTSPGSGTGGYFGFSAYGTCAVDFDNFRMYPHTGLANSTSYDRVHKNVISTTDQYGAISKSLFNDWQENVATINPKGVPQVTHMGSSSRFRSNSNYVTSDPDVSLVTTVNGLNGYYEEFDQINPRWTYHSYSSKSIWYWTGGKLGLWSSGGNSNSVPDGYQIDIGKNLSGRIGIEFDVRQRDNTNDRGFGIAIGDAGLNQNSSTSAVTLSFRGISSLDYCNATNCTATSGWSTLTTQVRYAKQHRIKIIADTDTDKADIYVNGKLYRSDLNFRKASSIIRKIRFFNYGRGASTEWKIDNLVVYENPVHRMTFTDAAGKTIQAQTEEPGNKIMVSEPFYDQLGRAAITAKATRTSSTANFGYRAGFVTNGGTTPPSTISGEVKTWNGNDSYAFTRTKYEKSPLGRTLETSRPGYLYRIGGGQNATTDYETNSDNPLSDFYMGKGYRDNTYSATRITDSDGSKNITFLDKTGRVVMQKEGPVTISTVRCSPNEVVDTGYYSWYASPSVASFDTYTPSMDVTATFTVYSYNPGASFLVGTALYPPGLGNMLNITSSGTYSVNLSEGNLVYFSWSSGFVGSISISFTCNNSSVVERDAFLTTEYDYNNEGELVKVYHPNYFELPPSGGDRNEFVTTYTYDSQGNVATATAPDNGTTRYLYDSKGRVMFSQDANGAAQGYVMYYKYDAYDRISQEGYWNRSWSGLSATTSVPNLSTWRKKYLYDDVTAAKLYQKNRLREVLVNNDTSTDPEVYEKYVYDVFGRITEHDTRVGEFDNTNHKITYAYDNAGKVLSTDYGQGFSPVLYNYYEENGSLKEIGSSSYSSEYAFYTYDKNGRIEYEYLDWKTKPFKYNYDITGRLTSIDDTYNYYYDQTIYYTGGYGGTNNTGLINKVNNSYKTSSTFFNSLAQKPQSYEYRYSYDQIGQLKVADHSLHSWRDIGVYGSRVNQYDANRNVIRKQEGTGNSSYNQKRYSYNSGTNQMKNTDGSSSSRYQYDSNGNQTSNADNYASMQYDRGINKIDQFSRFGSNTHFQYGANNQRVYKRLDPAGSGSDVKTIYIRGLSDYPLVEKINENGTTRNRFYIYGPTGIVASNIDNIDHYHVKDYQGSTRVLFRQGGAIAAWYDYLPYGNLAASYNSQLSKYRYTGQEYDTETGIHNFRARLYDGKLGAFYSVDPAAQFSSPYVGIGNNPVNYVDPDGEWIHIAIGAVVGGAINLAMNWESIDSPWEGIAAFGAGAAAGGATAACGACGGALWIAAAGGAVTSATNNIISQTGDDVGLDDVNWGQVGISAGVGGVSGVAGYGASKWATKNLANPIINGFNVKGPAISGLINGTVGGAAGGAAGGFTGGYLLSGGDIEAGLNGAWSGFTTGGIIGGGAGLGSGYYQARRMSVDPWTGKSLRPTYKALSPNAKGDQGVNQAIKDIQDLGGEVLGERPAGYKLSNGRRGFTDLIVELEGEIIIVEVKNGPSAGLNSNQKINYPLINQGDLPTFSGPNGQVVPSGTTTIKVIVIHYTIEGRIIYSPYR